MQELITLYSNLLRVLQGMEKSLAKLTDLNAHNLTEDWNRKPDTLRILGVSPRTLDRYIKTGKLPSSKVNGIVFIKTADIERLLNENYHNKN